MKKYFTLNGGITVGMALNINGRVCLYFAIMWGFLGIILIRIVNPLLNKLINIIKNKFNKSILKITLSLLMCFIVFDAAISTIALKSFYTKIVTDFDLDLTASEYSFFHVENELFNENNMLLTYPNLQIARNEI